eukprot:TRINITY_DN1281_c0_g3_i1.p1 TRINITY_DN1281_c0_g3~~TRINITY_DN1281_c0_g3_i1.p1  ORF type:complete len:427 (+),score=125.11 TRINITY_DN1281_c0_g3_i1:82-1362(+)
MATNSESRNILAPRAVAAAVGGCAAMSLCAGSAFVAPNGGVAEVAQLSPKAAGLLRGNAKAAPDAKESGFPAAAGVGLAVTAAAAGLARRQNRTARNAAAVKKKGVRVVEGKEIPWNLFSPKAPYAGKCISNDTITSETDLVNWETCHVVMDHAGKVPYIEGQSIGIIAPGPDKKGEVPAKIRLYSIASSSPGDDETSKTVSLCVKRVVEVEGRGWCNYSNVEKGKDKEFPDAEKVYRGVCSSHICDLKPDQEVLITGPTGAEMLLPEDPEANVIYMATGTGIAPFRSHLMHLFHDKASKGKFEGLAWLFLGVPYSNSILYDEENKAMQAEYPDQFRYDYAVSNENKCAKNKINGEQWVQHKMMEHTDALWELVKSPKTHVYMCGLKGMETGFAEVFEEVAQKEGVDLKEFVKDMKKSKRYHVEVY